MTLDSHTLKLLANETASETIARDPAMSHFTCLAPENFRKVAQARIERGDARAPGAAPRAAAKPAAPQKPTAPKPTTEAELARRLAAVEKVLGPIGEAASPEAQALDRAFGLADSSEAGVRFDARTATQSFGGAAPAPRLKAEEERSQEALAAAFADPYEPGAVVDDGVIQRFGVKGGTR